VVLPPSEAFLICPTNRATPAKKNNPLIQSSGVLPHNS
jgi:hypothetical protein